MSYYHYHRPPLPPHYHNSINWVKSLPRVLPI
jgi:hypothetical protein